MPTPTPLSHAAPLTTQKAIDAIARVSAIPSILEVCLRVTGMGFAAVARVTDSEWTACAVRDEIAFGLGVGGKLDLKTTICDEVRTARETVAFDDALTDPVYAEHHTPRIYGLRSYISTPIIRANGELFGTLCAIDPQPNAASKTETVETFKLFAQLIAAQLDADDRLAASEEALASQQTTADLREQFIAVLGHDLRNPLAAAQAGTALLRRMAQSDKAKDLLRQIEASHHRMGRLIDDVLDFARGRLGGGIGVERRQDARVQSMLEQVIEEVRASHPDRVLTVDLSLPGAIAADPDRIGQLLSNLLANAVTHGAATGEIRVAGGFRDGVLELSVSNQGEPIPDTAMEGLFEPFRRGQERTAAPREGLGLGLYIASQIAAAHEGELTARSDAGETCFTFRMPHG